MVNGAVRYYGVGVEEKRPYGLTLVVKGVPSHGSRPTRQNPVPRLVAALDRVARYETPLHVVPGVARYFKALSQGYTGKQRAWLADVAAATKVPAARAWLTSDIYWNAILRNTISLTTLTGSNKVNVIPPEASASLDVRLLPDQDPGAFVAQLRRIIADSLVQVIVPTTMKARMDNSIDTDCFARWSAPRTIAIRARSSPLPCSPQRATDPSTGRSASSPTASIPSRCRVPTCRKGCTATTNGSPWRTWVSVCGTCTMCCDMRSSARRWRNCGLPQNEKGIDRDVQRQRGNAQHSVIQPRSLCRESGTQHVML